MRSIVVLLALMLPVTGQAAFGPQQVITTSADGPLSVYATDLDGDGDADVLSASWLDNKIAWYENLIVPAPPPPACPNGACLDLLGTSTIGSPLSLLLQSPAANKPCYVIADTALYGDPAGFAVATIGSTTYYAHLLLGAGAIPLADPSGTFGPSLTNPYTDANGNWSLSLQVPNDPTLAGLAFYGEAFVGDFSLFPNGLFHQSNVLTVTIH